MLWFLARQMHINIVHFAVLLRSQKQYHEQQQMVASAATTMIYRFKVCTHRMIALPDDLCFIVPMMV